MRSIPFLNLHQTQWPLWIEIPWQTNDKWSFHSWHRQWLMSACQQYTLTHDQGRNISSHVAASVFLHVTSSHLTARHALLLCVDVDGGLIDACECVVPRIVSKGMKKWSSFYFWVHGNRWKKGIYFNTRMVPKDRFLLSVFWDYAQIINYIFRCCWCFLLTQSSTASSCGWQSCWPWAPSCRRHSENTLYASSERGKKQITLFQWVIKTGF